MSALHLELARVNHEMYQSMFNYEKEFRMYHDILKEHECGTVLEIGCGSGSLTKYFVREGYRYTGLDKSPERLSIACELNPDIEFIQGDMREFSVKKPVDAVIISGRSFTYMTKNKDVNSALKCICKSLKSKGILIFDSFNAKEVFLNFRKDYIQRAECNGRKYMRVSKNSMNLNSGWTWKRVATYYIEEKGKDTRVLRDKTTLRAFTEEELSLFLELNGFKVLKMLNNGMLTFIAQKKTGSKH